MEFVVVELIVIIQSGTELVYPKKWEKNMLCTFKVLGVQIHM